MVIWRDLPPTSAPSPLRAIFVLSSGGTGSTAVVGGELSSVVVALAIAVPADSGLFLAKLYVLQHMHPINDTNSIKIHDKDVFSFQFGEHISVLPSRYGGD